ncbi:hypothetical protein H9Y04_06555 [Streptomyces sp. TRM66268-LWL]|uniref:Uncharacterized protein n=1 Tax=Streptomyces polyasparticus TaxID=2767826 RepID=A0ABR7SB80_9ACTN|nr:hypothetical protein [Streptomyces polyasparticus]MBC9712232.1 hypothetical protein [Streptomyces polyasparticus]
MIIDRFNSDPSLYLLADDCADRGTEIAAYWVAKGMTDTYGLPDRAIRVIAGADIKNIEMRAKALSDLLSFLNYEEREEPFANDPEQSRPASTPNLSTPRVCYCVDCEKETSGGAACTPSCVTTGGAE